MLKILNGSFEYDFGSGFVKAGVYNETENNEIKDLRYVGGYVSDVMKSEKLGNFLCRIYENSTGSLLTNDFKTNFS